MKLRAILLPVGLLAFCEMAPAASVLFSIQLGQVVPAGSGLAPGQVFSGVLGYDEARIATVGDATLTPANDPSLTVRFDFGGVGFDETLDTDPDFPQLYFTDGSFAGMNFLARNNHPASSDDGYLQIETTPVGTLVNYSFDGSGEYGGVVEWGLAAVVPEPSGFGILCMAGCLALKRGRR